LEFESPTGFGQATIEVTDQTMGAQPSHTITFQTLPSAGHTVFLRVGSCIQWHGYQAGELHLVTSGAPADMSVRLLT
jgi:uridine phosphorylase